MFSKDKKFLKSESESLFFLGNIYDQHQIKNKTRHGWQLFREKSL